MNLNSINEWDELKSVIVGTANYAHWPVNCPDFRKQEQTTLWKETPLPSGPVPQWIIDEANEDLNYLVKTLTDLDIRCMRPLDINFQNIDGMYNYCPRDRMLVYGDTMYDVPMTYQCRDAENYAYLEFISYTKKIRDGNARFDAANICRLGNSMLYLTSETGNLAGYFTMCEIFDVPVYIVNCYSGVHIDSTIVPIQEGLVMLNADRINETNVPEPLKSWDKIWIEKTDLVHQPFYEYPYASNWIAMNLLVVNPNLVILDPKQTAIRKKLAAWGVESIGVDLRHSRTLGGGHHCVTLDLERKMI